MNKQITAAVLALGLAFTSASVLANADKKSGVDLGLDVSTYVGVPMSQKNSKSDRLTDSTVRVTVRTKLSDGISIGGEMSADATYEHESDDNFLRLDVEDANVFVESKFGRAVVGRADNAAVALHLGAPDVGYGSNGTNLDSWVHGVGFRDLELLNSAFDRTSLRVFNNQRNKFSVYTPSLYGLTVGFSYVPKFSSDVEDSAFMLGGRFDRKFGDTVGFGLSVGLASHQPAMAMYDHGLSYSVGSNVSFDRLTVGGSFARTNRRNRVATGWDAGISYRVNPKLDVSVTYQVGRSDGSSVPAMVLDDNSELVDGMVFGNTKQTRNAVMVSGSYEFVSGAKGVLSLGRVSYKTSTGVDTKPEMGEVDSVPAMVSSRKSSAFVVLTGLKLRF